MVVHMFDCSSLDPNVWENIGFPSKTCIFPCAFGALNGPLLVCGFAHLYSQSNEML